MDACKHCFPVFPVYIVIVAQGHEIIDAAVQLKEEYQNTGLYVYLMKSTEA